MTHFRDLSAEIMSVVGLINNLRDINGLLPDAFEVKELFNQLSAILSEWSDYEFS
jgi:hypothetical protein